MNQTILQEKLSSKEFQKRLQIAQNFEKYSGSGTIRKIKRLLFAPSIYIPYLLLVKAKVFKIKKTSTRLFWGRKINIPLQDYDSLALFRFGFAGGTEAELKLVKYFVKTLKETDIFYDIGANYGFFSYMASEICKEIHLFEPNTELIEILKNNSDIKKVTINDTALSDKKGEAELFLSESSGLSTINTSTINTHSYKFTNSKPVKTTTLDIYTQNHTQPTFIKIDVEGAEESVIRGAIKLLSSNAPIIALEVWGKNNGGDISMKAVDLLRTLGYKSFSIDKQGNLDAVSGDLSEIAPGNGGDNFIFRKN
jgi:FkbM family methyltransferase